MPMVLGYDFLRESFNNGQVPLDPRMGQAVEEMGIHQ